MFNFKSVSFLNVNNLTVYNVFMQNLFVYDSTNLENIQYFFNNIKIVNYTLYNNLILYDSIENPN